MDSDSTARRTNDTPQLPIALKDPSSETVLMKLNPEADPEGIISRLGMEKMASGETLSRLLGSMPEIASAIALSQSFRIIMPAGVVGNLMKLTSDPRMSGLFTTSVVGSSNSIVGTAGLASMSGFAAPIMVWTILSFLTGQFFLTQIQRNTQAIFDELRNILYFLVAKEESDLRARIEFLRYVSDNFAVLSQSSAMRTPTLTNLQKANLESLAGLKLWVFNTNKTLRMLLLPWIWSNKIKIKERI
ncbi:MAG: hypothetical protein HC838_07595 [Spirulinaceae cyanobacterium RM2_2_10]|nr:hypothetical protein [Spirulinaceae cyanobacterium SM2_1_0]NJO19945.1 hypothetical protein [Spirulinaceae cyanobacterium RM2_2_10]